MTSHRPYPALSPRATRDVNVGNLISPPSGTNSHRRQTNKRKQAQTRAEKPPRVGPRVGPWGYAHFARVGPRLRRLFVELVAISAKALGHDSADLLVLPDNDVPSVGEGIHGRVRLVPVDMSIDLLFR